MASILVVDDEPGVRSSISGVLKDEGFDVDTASTGEECLEKANGAAFDVVVLDIWLPGLDGLTTLQRLRERQIDAQGVIMHVTHHPAAAHQPILQKTVIAVEAEANVSLVDWLERDRFVIVGRPTGMRFIGAELIDDIKACHKVERARDERQAGDRRYGSRVKPALSPELRRQRGVVGPSGARVGPGGSVGHGSHCTHYPRDGGLPRRRPQGVEDPRWMRCYALHE